MKPSLRACFKVTFAVRARQPLPLFSQSSCPKMKLVCKQLRLSDTWFQTGFVVVFLCSINAAFFVWPDANFQKNLSIILLIDTFFLMVMFRNTQVWVTPQNNVRLTHTIFCVIPWRSRSIPHANMVHVTVKRISDRESWPNFTADLHWTENSLKGMLVTKSTTILQRRQGLSTSVAEAKQVAKSLGIKFVDNTNKKKFSTKQHTDPMEPDF